MYNPICCEEERGFAPMQLGKPVPSENSKACLHDRRYMKMAYTWAENSYAIRKRVGALIVKEGMIISDGYNGTPSGFPNVCEYIRYSDFSEGHFSDADSLHRAKDAIEAGEVKAELCTESHVLHAEANAITKLAKHGGIGSAGATIYTTTQPCMECSKLIIQAGIGRVVYCESYHDTEGLRLLRQAGIEVERIDKFSLSN